MSIPGNYLFKSANVVDNLTLKDINCGIAQHGKKTES